MTCLGVLNRGERDKDDETGLKEGGGIEMSTTVLLRLIYLPLITSDIVEPDFSTTAFKFSNVCFVSNATSPAPTKSFVLDMGSKATWPETNIILETFPVTTAGLYTGDADKPLIVAL